MGTGVKVGGYALGLVAVFAAMLGVGRLVGPSEPAPGAGGTGGHAASDEHPTGGLAGSVEPAAGAVRPPGGLQVAEDGYRLVVTSARLAVGEPAPFTFRVLGPGGTPVTSYASTHDQDLHLIVVRRDLSGFQHLHPTRAADGTWSIPLAVATPGQYRAFADFQPAGRDKPLTLGVDLAAAGDYRPEELPAPAGEASVADYTIALDGRLVPGVASRLSLTVHRDGQPVTDLEPYLAAYGHLVALRDGDLAYLHVHPGGRPGDGRTTPGPTITFFVDVPSSGTYRLFLDFQHAGEVRTASFTMRAL